MFHHLWTCPGCGQQAIVLTDTRITCRCKATSFADINTPLATSADIDRLLDEE